MLAFAEYERGTIVERTQTGKTVPGQDLPPDHHYDRNHSFELREEHNEEEGAVAPSFSVYLLSSNVTTSVVTELP
jgi:hypothetical protein